MGLFGLREFVYARRNQSTFEQETHMLSRWMATLVAAVAVIVIAPTTGAQNPQPGQTALNPSASLFPPGTYSDTTIAPWELHLRIDGIDSSGYVRGALWGTTPTAGKWHWNLNDAGNPRAPQAWVNNGVLVVKYPSPSATHYQLRNEEGMLTGPIAGTGGGRTARFVRTQ
jgi:hypothetical protein